MEFNMAVYSTNVSRLHRNAPRSPRILQQKYNEKGTPKRTGERYVDKQGYHLECGRRQFRKREATSFHPQR